MPKKKGGARPIAGKSAQPVPLSIHRILPLSIHRILRLGIKEVVIATDPDTEGEMTALYLIDELKPLGIKLSRIGMGLPMGSSVEYVDHSTLIMSMNARREILA